jgi:hypothetical protein
MMMGSEKGSVLVIVITGITIIAAIGAGVASMINSSARTGVDQSLSVQAFYAAESGLERAGLRLREVTGSWASYCENEGLTEEDPPQFDSASFSIEKTTKILNDDDEPIGCEITVSGWVGSQDNPLAKRQIIGDISGIFIENMGGNGDFEYDEKVEDLVTGGNIKKELNQGNLLIANSTAGGNIEVEIKHEGNVVIEDSTAGGNIIIEIKGNNQDTNKVFIKNTTSGGNMEIEVKHEGDVCFESINTGGNIKIEIESDGNVCLKNENNVGGNITVEIKRDGDVCIQDSAADDIGIKIERDGDVCVKDDTIADDIEIDIKRNGSPCIESETACSCPCSCQFCDINEEGGETIQNPVGTEDGSWSEG